MSAPRVCAREGCERSLEGRQANARYCTDRCRVAACRARKTQETQDVFARVAGTGGSDVTLTGPPVTLSDLLGGPCADPTHCEHRLRHASGPWSCAHNHPRTHPKGVVR